MDRIYLVVAASGSGKDYAVDKLNNYGYKKVVSRTTRKPRYIKENTHLFVSETQADIEFNREDVIAKTNYNGNRYYTLPTDLKGKDFYIIDVKGVRSISEGDLFNYTIVTIKSSALTRFKNMRKRGDKLTSVLKRLWVDRKEFRDIKGTLNFVSSDDFIEYFKSKKVGIIC